MVCLPRSLFASGFLFSTCSVFAFVACSSGSSATSTSTTGDASISTTSDAGPAETAVDGISATLIGSFQRGEIEFNRVLGENDGLGPLYTKTSCDACHTLAGRGPGVTTKMMIVEADGTTPSPDQSLLPYGNTEHPLVVTDITGAHTPILPPFVGSVDGGASGSVSVRVTTRMGPPLFGRGFMDAIDDSTIEALETSQATRTDGIHGRANHVTFVSQPNPDQTFDTHNTGDSVVGKFGVKARIATLDEFAADALQGDMGITSPMRPTEFINPDHVLDDLKIGIDVTADQMNARAAYVRLLAIPPRAPLNGDTTGGKEWFETCSCDVCHAESVHTSSSYPIPQLANVDAPLYTDMLLHDMGDGLADSVTGENEGQAGPRDWRTAPLIGLRFNTSFLHDGRASTINDAILAHQSNGSEAARALDCFVGIDSASRQTLLDFVSTL